MAVTQEYKCPFCGSHVVMAGQISGDLKPDFVIPFKLDKKATKEALRKHYKGKRLLPGVFKTEDHMDEVKGVYVPFWLFDTKADVNMRYTAAKVRIWSDSEYDYKETKHYIVNRSGKLSFESVPVDGSVKMPDDLLESIKPFDFSTAVDFRTAYLADCLVEKYDVSVEQSIERANEQIRKSVRDAFLETVKGYAAVTKEAESIRFENGRVTYALLPVWLLSTTWNGENYLFAMNGQTGKLAGDLPLDKAAYKKWLFGLTGVFLAFLLTVFAGFAKLCDDFIIQAETGGNFGIIGIVPAFGTAVIMALIVTEIMRWQLKTVYSQSAADNYIKQDSMQLTKKDDLLLYKHVERKKRHVLFR